MGIFFVYILKSSVCLTLFYLFFKCLLSRETFHRFNRAAVLGILVLSLLVPLCQVTLAGHTQVGEAVLSIRQLLMLASLQEAGAVAVQDVNALSWARLLAGVYVAGVLFFLVKTVRSYICLGLMIKKMRQRKLINGQVVLVHPNQTLSPFSWMRYIVIPEKDLQESGAGILAHEQAHIALRHSWDLLGADLCIIFQWFNPAAWLLKRELQSIHEYQADEAVINQGIDAKQYQLLLIKKAVGTRLYSMANSFNHSKLKKRITMMLKEKSSPWARLKYLYVLPLVAIAVTAFARPEVSNELQGISIEQQQPQPNDSIPSNVLVLVDGKEVPISTIQTINAESIESISVLKDKSATDLYGEKGKNGVILITLKKGDTF